LVIYLGAFFGSDGGGSSLGDGELLSSAGGERRGVGIFESAV
jgi:hypothetical protein